MRTTIIAAGLVLAALAAPVLAQDAKPGRYTMSPADGGGFVRLDTDSGTMALCTRKGADWSCQEMADGTRDLRRENDRLAAENRELKADVRRLEEMLGLGDGKKAEGDRRAERQFQLPSEEDVDKALSYVERMIKKFREKLKQFESEGKGTPL